MTIATDPNDPALGGNVIGGDPDTYHPVLWDWLIENFNVKSMLDVGCGEGHCVRYFAEHGVDAIGIDGLAQNVERAVATVVQHDLRTAPYFAPVDLVHCCEVVEHIDEEHLPYLLETLANGRVIAMTHGVPGQAGYHHVNCQPQVYWVSYLFMLGYQFRGRTTQMARQLVRDSGHWTYFADTGLIFTRP